MGGVKPSHLILESMKDELFEIIRIMESYNDKVVVGGSFSCAIQGCDLEREVNDVDFVFTEGSHIKIPSEFKPIQMFYGNHNYGLLAQFKYKGIKVDFLRSNTDNFIKIDDSYFATLNSIVKAKKSYGFVGIGNNEEINPDIVNSWNKHQGDIIKIEAFMNLNGIEAYETKPSFEEDDLPF